MQDWLAHRARATPGREALVNAASGNAWSYATLDETVGEMAGRLRALGVEQDDHLAAVLGTGVEAVCLVHAAMRLGTTLVPLSAEFTPPELRARLERADADAVVCNASTEETVTQAAQASDSGFSVLTIDEAEGGQTRALSDAESVDISPAEWSREDVQLLLFTSGTTGEPKAVQLTMGNLLASATASAFRLGIDPDDRWLVPLSLHHMGGIAPILRSTLYGTTAVIRPSFDPGGTVDDLRSYDATCVSLVPTMLRRMLSARGTLPDSLRFVLVGGAPCPEELIDRCRDFSVPVCPTYGMTETASQVATARHREAYEHPASVGRPLIWTDVTVVDETGTPVEAGETGEVVVSGPTVTPGYYDDHAATGEAMGPHGLHTGDVGYQDGEGRLYVLNRLDDRILTGGENVDPGEVVDALQAHDAVSDAAVVGLSDPEWGEQVAALLIPDNADEPPAIEELESFLRERLAGFKLPRTIAFTDELPRTVSGTVEREAVRERLLEGESQEIERTVDSARAAGNERAATGETRLERETGPESSDGQEPEPADEAPASEQPEAADAAAGAGTEAEPADATVETETEAEPIETPGEDAADTASARSILDAGGAEDRPDRESVASIQELSDAQGDAGERSASETDEVRADDAEEPLGRAAVRESTEDPVDGRAIGAEDPTSEDGEREGLIARSQPDEGSGPPAELGETDSEFDGTHEESDGTVDEPVGEAAESAARQEADEEPVPEPARKGGAALSGGKPDGEQRSGVRAEPGAALGSGRAEVGEADADGTSEPESDDEATATDAGKTESERTHEAAEDDADDDDAEGSDRTDDA